MYPNKLKTFAVALFIFFSLMVGVSSASAACVRFKKQWAYDTKQWNYEVPTTTACQKHETAPKVDTATFGFYFLVSRHGLAASGAKFSHGIQIPVGGGGNFSFGVGTSAKEPTQGSDIQYQINTNGAVLENGNVVASMSLSNSDVFEWERVGTSLVLKQNGSTRHTFNNVAVPVFLQSYIYYANAPQAHFAFTNASVTGTTVSEATPSAAPTISATSGHKRNHIAITYPSGANGVSIFRSTTSGVFDFGKPVVTEYRYAHFEDTGLTNGTTYYYVARATKDGLSESASSAQTSATPLLNNIPTMTTGISLIIGSPTVKPIGDVVVANNTDWVNIGKRNLDDVAEKYSVWQAVSEPLRSFQETIAGTVSVANNGLVVTGTGTQFLTDYQADGVIRIRDADDVKRVFRIYWVESDTKIHLWDFNPYWGATATGLLHRPSIDDADNESVSGSVSVTNGSTIVTGSGTDFWQDYRTTNFIGITGTDGVKRFFEIEPMYSGTQITLKTPYSHTSGSGLAHKPQFDNNLDDGDQWDGQVHYYDTTLTLYHVYYRTGSLLHLELARKNVAAWRSYVESQKNGGDYNQNPRAVALLGIALRAIDIGGDNAYWQTVKNYVDNKEFWITNQTNQNPNAFDEVRERAYIIQYCAAIGAAHPTASVRTAYTAQALFWHQEYFHTQMDKYSDKVPRTNLTDFDFGGGERRYYHFSQPFINGIFGETAAMIYRLTGDAGVKSRFLAFVDGTTAVYTTKQTTAGVRLRQYPYATYHSDTATSVFNYPTPENPFVDLRYIGDTGDRLTPEPIPAPPAGFGNGRFLNSIMLYMYGAAYNFSGEAKYKTQGDEIIKANYSFDDTQSAMQDVVAKGKNLNEALRRGQAYPAFTDVIAPEIAGNTTPAPPTVIQDNAARTVDAAHALGDAELLISINFAAFTSFDGTPVSVGLGARAAGYVRFKVQAAAGRNESAVASSAAFAAAGNTPQVGVGYFGPTRPPVQVP